MRREKRTNRKKKGFANCKKGFYKPINEDKYRQPMDKYMNSNPIPEYRSSWELKAYTFFDLNKNVQYWTTEPFAISYLSPKDNKIHRYFPDILVKFISGKKFLIEVKPSSQISNPIVQAKAKAAIEFCKKNDMEYIFLTEKELGI